MNKPKLIAEFKKAYLSVHGVKCKGLILGEWSHKQLKDGVNTLNFILDRK